MTRAAMSLPTPLSPVMRTFASDFAAHSTSDRMVHMAGLVPIRLSIVRSTLFPLLGRQAYQRAAKGENAPKVRIDGTYVLDVDGGPQRAPTASKVPSMPRTTRCPAAAISGAQPNRDDAARRT